MPASYKAHRKQLEVILSSWGMSATNAANAAEIMSWADLHGVDSHGISMIPSYNERRQLGKINMQAEPDLSRETPVSALVDAHGSLGHVSSRFAMSTAIEKARTSGIGITTVHNSSHFGACGFYALMAAEAGFIGLVMTSASGVQVAPAGGTQARLGTDPIAFAAPGVAGDEPFLLDMATTTVAAGKIRNKANENLQCPPGWVVDKDGLASTDPLVAREKGGSLTSLGGSLEGSSYKGYGLAAMVNILSAALSGATLITDPMHTKKPGTMDIGHFFLAIDPGLFRDGDDFRSDVSAFCNALRSTTPVDATQPVMVAGDPQWRLREQRLRDGIPVGANLLAQVRTIAKDSGAPWVMDE